MDGLDELLDLWCGLVDVIQVNDAPAESGDESSDVTWRSGSTCLRFETGAERTHQLHCRFPVSMPTARALLTGSMLSLAPFPVTIASEGAHTHSLTHTLVQPTAGATGSGEAAC